MSKMADVDTDWGRVSREYQRGASLRMLAKKWHRSPETIKGYLEGYAVVLRPPARYTPIPEPPEEERIAREKWERNDRLVSEYFALVAETAERQWRPC